MKTYNYKISPSLLDKFQKVCDAAETFEDFANIDAEGNYRRSFDEIEQAAEQDLLDSINKVPHEPIEAADKGTAFNELVDLLNGRPVTQVEKALFFPSSGIVPAYYETHINGFCFTFDAALVQSTAKRFEGASAQFLCECGLDTAFGSVLLYGYPDEILFDTVYDIKTTARYEYGKFAKSWQKHVYPWALVKSGRVASIDKFEFSVFRWIDKEGAPLTADTFAEAYPFDLAESETCLRSVCEAFIPWLENHRELITNRKIFGEE